jgi:hypothetical protein
MRTTVRGTDEKERITNKVVKGGIMAKCYF